MALLRDRYHSNHPTNRTARAMAMRREGTRTEGRMISSGAELDFDWEIAGKRDMTLTLSIHTPLIQWMHIPVCHLDVHPAYTSQCATFNNSCGLLVSSLIVALTNPSEEWEQKFMRNGTGTDLVCRTYRHDPQGPLGNQSHPLLQKPGRHNRVSLGRSSAFTSPTHV